MARATLRVRILLLLAMVVVASPSFAVPHRNGTARAQIEALEEQWRQAAISDDTEKMDHLLADDFLGITANGQVVTKLQQLDRMRTHQFAISRFEVTDMKIKLISEHAAIVTSLARIEATNEGRPFHGSFRYTRVYQRTASGGWKITSFEATRVPRHNRSPAGSGDGEVQPQEQ